MQEATAAAAPSAPWEGDVTFAVECRMSRDAVSGQCHPVTIRADWTAITPHDLDAERIAHAFGGYTSCLDLVDRTIPRLRESLRRTARAARPSPRRDKRGNWRVPADEIVDCCRRTAFPSVSTVVSHLRTSTHLAHLLDVPAWQAEQVISGTETACLARLGAAAESARFVREPDGVARLWDAGIHPSLVAAIAAHADVVSGPLPATYFEGIVYSGADPEWMRGVLAFRPDADTAAWLAWQAPPETMGESRDWGLWLTYGASRRAFASAIEHGVPATGIADVAASTRWTLQTAARVVREFAEAGCFPTPSQLAIVGRCGAEHAIPGPSSVDGVVEDATLRGANLSRTELGVMLAVVGNRPQLRSALQRGIRDLHDLQSVRP